MSVDSELDSFGGDCYFKLPHNDFSVYSAFTYSDGMILFKDERVQPISISAISETVLEGNNLIFKGTFFQDDQIVYQIEMYLYKIHLRDKLLKIVGNIVESAKAKFILTNNDTYKEFEVEVKKKNDKISIQDASSHKTYAILDRTDKLMASDNVLLFFNKQGHAYYLIFEGTQIPLELSQFNLDNNAYYHACCQLYGSLSHIRLQGKEVSIMLDDHSIYIFVDYHENYSFSYSQLKVYQEHSNGNVTYEFISSDGELSYITSSKKPDALSSLDSVKPILEHQIIFIDQEPFRLTFENAAWSFYQSMERSFPIKIDQLNQIEIIDNSNPERTIVTFHINFEPGNLSFYAHGSLLPVLYEKTFRGKKVSLLKEASVTDLYTSWSRQVNDFLLFNLFGQLVLLQTGIEEILDRKGITRQQKNKQILNFMYEAIKEQRRIFDRIALQFPELLLAEDRQLFTVDSDLPYEALQKQLLSMSVQMQRHLNEIENSLNQLSFAIIPRKTISKKQADTSSNAKYWGAAALTGLGALTGGVGLLVGGGLLALNTYLSSKDKDIKQQYTEENEDYKIEFYINRALDSFEHLMETMMPYYVSQVSKAHYNLTKKQGLQLLKLNAAEVDRSKNRMFSRLAELYVAKQMPMEQGNLLTRENIMEILMSPKADEEKLLIGSLTE